MPALDYNTKAQAAAHERHFVKRARKRFGLRVSPERYRRFCRQIIEVSNGVAWLWRDPENPHRTLWVARFGGYLMRVVFDEQTECLVTCMPYAERVDTQFLRDHRAKVRRLKGHSPRKNLRHREHREPNPEGTEPIPCN